MSVSILKHEKRLNNMEIVRIVSPKGWGYEGEYENHSIMYDYSISLKDCDTVWIVNSRNEISFDFDIKDKICEAVSEDKNIIITRNLNSKQRKELEIMIPREKLYMSLDKKEDISLPETELLYDFSCPIVYIVGTTEFTNRFEILLSLREAFENKGYKSLLICDRVEGQEMGCAIFPDIFENSNVKEVDKIKIINSFVRKKVLKETPDIVFVMVSGRLLGANKFYIENSVVNAFELSYAVPPDCIILSMMYTENFDFIIENIQNQCKRLFGFFADYINIADRLLDDHNEESGNEINYLTLDNLFVREKIQKFSKEKNKLVSLQEKTSFEDMTVKLINLLAQYGNTEVV